MSTVAQGSDNGFEAEKTEEKGQAEKGGMDEEREGEGELPTATYSYRSRAVTGGGVRATSTSTSTSPFTSPATSTSTLASSRGVLVGVLLCATGDLGVPSTVRSRIVDIPCRCTSGSTS